MASTPTQHCPPWDPARVAERNNQLFEQFTREAASIRDRHAAQTLAQAEALRRKYQAPVFGEIATWSLFEMLAHCIDTADDRLYCASQETHVLQMIEAMEADGVASEELVLAALAHDIGKVALLKGELPENLFYMNAILVAGAPGAGLDACTFQWSCDDLGWSRLKNHLPPPVAWLVRYHGIDANLCAAYMNELDRDRAQRYLMPFQLYDLYSKSPFFRPRHRLEDFRPLIEKHLPPTLIF
jgi:hypothetical protein